MIDNDGALVRLQFTATQVPVPSVRDALGQHHTARVLRRAGYNPLPPYHPEGPAMAPRITLHTAIPAESVTAFHVWDAPTGGNAEIIGAEEMMTPRVPKPVPWSEQQISSLRRVLDYDELRRPR